MSKRWRAVLAAGTLCIVLGSVHAFSVLIATMEATYASSRANISLTYSIALLMITAAVFLGPRLYRLANARVIFALSGCLAAAGVLVAALGSSLATAWLGYGIVFGAANGIGYGFGLQFAARANQGHEGLAMGLVTACYALGAIAAPVLFEVALAAGGLKTALTHLAITLLAATVLAVALAPSDKLYDGAPEKNSNATTPSSLEMTRLWLGYTSAVFAGLMVIGHSAEIARWAGIHDNLWIAPALLACLNLAGSTAGGLLSDRTRTATLLTFIPVASAAAIALAASAQPVLTLAGLAGAGFCYGATISIYPALIAKHYGMEMGPKVYGRVFTGWGLAGLTGPWLAGSTFDAFNSYSPALWIAAGLSVISALAWRLRSGSV